MEQPFKPEDFTSIEELLLATSAVCGLGFVSMATIAAVGFSLIAFLKRVRLSPEARQASRELEVAIKAFEEERINFEEACAEFGRLILDLEKVLPYESPGHAQVENLLGRIRQALEVRSQNEARAFRANLEDG